MPFANPKQVSGRIDAQPRVDRGGHFAQDFSGATVAGFDPLIRLRIDRRFAAEVLQRCHSPNAAASRIERAAPEVAALRRRSSVGVISPLLHDSQTHGPRLALLMEVDIAVEIPGTIVPRKSRLVGVAAGLLIAGDMLPVLRIGERNLARIGSGPDIDFGQLAVDFLDREPADFLSRVPFHLVDGRRFRRQGGGPSSVPFPGRIDLPRVDPHLIRLQSREAPTEQLHAFDASEPTRPVVRGDACGIDFLGCAILVGAILVGQRIEIGFFDLRVAFGQQRVERVGSIDIGLRNADAQGSRLSVGRSRQTNPTGMRLSRKGNPIVIRPRIRRQLSVWLEDAQVDLEFRSWARKHDAAQRHRFAEGDHHELLAGIVTDRFQMDREVRLAFIWRGFRLTGRSVGQPQQSQKLASRIRLHAAGAEQIGNPFGIPRQALFEIHNVRAGRVVEVRHRHLKGQKHLARVCRHSGERPLPRRTGDRAQDFDRVRGRVHP